MKNFLHGMMNTKTLKPTISQKQREKRLLKIRFVQFYMLYVIVFCLAS